jgi:hypothetical protein
VDVTLNLEDRGLTCSTVQNSKDKQASSKYFWTCERSEGPFTVFASVSASKLNTVDFIEAAVIQLDNPSSSTAIDFLGFVATIPFIDDSASQQEAKDWVGNTIPTLTGEGDVRETTINGIRLVVYGLPTALTLEIGELR